MSSPGVPTAPAASRTSPTPNAMGSTAMTAHRTTSTSLPIGPGSRSRRHPERLYPITMAGFLPHTDPGDHSSSVRARSARTRSARTAACTRRCIPSLASSADT
ncbi:hypothetical protein GCM10023204_51100 [Actinomycetospora succinea]